MKLAYGAVLADARSVAGVVFKYSTLLGYTARQCKPMVALTLESPVGDFGEEWTSYTVANQAGHGRLAPTASHARSMQESRET